MRADYGLTAWRCSHKIGELRGAVRGMSQQLWMLFLPLFPKGHLPAPGAKLPSGVIAQ